jgi:hypothetical protein
LLLKSHLDAGQAASDLAGNEGLTAQRRLVIEKNPIAGVDSIRFAVIDANPVGVQLRYRVRTSRIKGGGLLLWNFLDQPIEFGGAGLIKLRLLFQAQDADCF